ncbi:replication initiation protein [Tortoise microvirus 10]|nr:replication initiation protein [Tortoise microvirus 10]QCS36999.1 replication initiation protein [Tortoise microvirus 10]
MSCVNPVTIRVNDTNYDVPCRRCMSCRLDYQIYLTFCAENELYDCYRSGLGASFCTFTYDDSHIPPNGSLCKKDLQNFLKTGRKNLERSGFPASFKYLACGEYGDKFGRPHYHVAFIGLSDVLVNEFFRSAWRHGLVDIGVLQPGGMRYILKYCTKAVLGDKAKELYDDKGLERPFITRSCKMGYEYLYRNIDDIVANNFTYVKAGIRRPIPKYLRDKFDLFKNYNSLPMILRIKTESDLYGYPDYRDWQRIKNYNREQGLISAARSKGYPVDDSSFRLTARSISSSGKELAKLVSRRS